MNYAFFAVALILFLPSAYDTLTLMQQSGYTAIRNRKYWIRICILSIIVVIATILSLCVGGAAIPVCFGICTFAELLTFAERFFRARGRLKFTKRALRLIIVSMLIYYMPAFLLFFFAPPATMCAAFLFAAPAVFLGAFASNPFEQKNNRRYETMLKEKLKASPHLIRVGITGSAGKTSVKNYLTEMLKTRYRVLTTGKNYNTPLGLWLSVKDENLDCYDIFVAEMGARKRGDIKELCELVKPDAGIVTAVLPQHLETFKTLEAIKAEKSELPKSIVSGIAVLNAYDENVGDMETETLAEVIKVGGNGAFRIEDLKSDWRGTSFRLITPLGEIPLATELIGRHNAVNIALAAAMALRLGIPKEDVQYAVECLKPVPHRLELTKTAGGAYVLDDGYNSNVGGAECALEILATYPGRRVVFSQGIVELGRMEKEENIALGRKIAEVADVLILTGRLGEYIYEGAMGKGDLGIVRVKNVKAGREALKTILEQGDLLYLQNDLPELYR